MKFAIIDGTGEYSDAKYDYDMAKSFCKQIHAQLPDSECHYERGPSGEGYRVEERGQRAADFLKTAGEKEKRYLAGYSRGGSAAIMAAEMLEKDKIDVDAMFLFDPVARHLSHGGEVVPKNVKQLNVAYRRLDPALVNKYDYTIGTVFTVGNVLSSVNPAAAEAAKLTFSDTKVGNLFRDSWLDRAVNKPVAGIAHNPFRVFFGNTGKKYLGNSAAADYRTFSGTHGALGGVGWPHVSEDKLCEIEVASFMNEAFTKNGISVELRSLLILNKT